MQNTWSLGRIFGIAVGIHWTWLIIFAYLTFSLATAYFPDAAAGRSDATYWVVGAVAAILLFGSVLVHELAHSLAARAQGMEVDRITLFIFGGISNIQERPPSPRIEFVMTVVGPLTSLALGGVFLGGAGIAGPDEVPWALLRYLGAVNIVLGLFNLIPGFPLDGGRILRSAIWAVRDDRAEATRIAAAVGLGVAWLLILSGLALALLTGDLIGGLWLALIGWFLSQVAGNRYQRATERAGA